MDGFCREESIEAGEPIAGSAVAATDVWVLLEHNRPWGAKAVVESDLPDPVKAALLGWEDSIPGARVQLIRGDAAVARTGSVALMVGISALDRASLVRFDLRDVTELPDVPGVVEALRRGREVAAEVVTRPVVLVCTNGKRDACCAKWGLPLYTALAARRDLDVWQTTHLGGHRFAPTLLSLPDGLCYGRVPLSRAEDLADAVLAGRVFDLSCLRGRTALSEAAQAAEAQWRAQSGEHRVAALTGASEVEHDGHVDVTLTDDTGATHEVSVQHRDLGRLARGSCAKDPGPVTGWFPVAHLVR